HSSLACQLHFKVADASRVHPNPTRQRGGLYDLSSHRRLRLQFHSILQVPNSARDTKMIRKLKSGEFRLYSRKANPKTGKRRNLGTFHTRAAAEQHEREVQYFKRH